MFRIKSNKRRFEIPQDPKTSIGNATPDDFPIKNPDALGPIEEKLNRPDDPLDGEPKFSPEIVAAMKAAGAWFYDPDEDDEMTIDIDGVVRRNGVVEEGEPDDCEDDEDEHSRSEKLRNAITEIVHQGHGRLFDADKLRLEIDGWKPTCCMNFEYTFEWKPELESLNSGTKRKWVDLSSINDDKGRYVYILEMGDAACSEDESLDSVAERHEEIWDWKAQGLMFFGPFASSEEAEKWMAENGTFEEVD